MRCTLQCKASYEQMEVHDNQKPAEVLSRLHAPVDGQRFLASAHWLQPTALATANEFTWTCTSEHASALASSPGRTSSNRPPEGTGRRRRSRRHAQAARAPTLDGLQCLLRGPLAARRAQPAHGRCGKHERQLKNAKSQTRQRMLRFTHSPSTRCRHVQQPVTYGEHGPYKLGNSIPAGTTRVGGAVGDLGQPPPRVRLQTLQRRQ